MKKKSLHGKLSLKVKDLSSLSGSTQGQVLGGGINVTGGGPGTLPPGSGDPLCNVVVSMVGCVPTNPCPVSADCSGTCFRDCTKLYADTADAICQQQVCFSGYEYCASLNLDSKCQC